MAVEVHRQSLDQSGQIDFTSKLVGQMEPGGKIWVLFIIVEMVNNPDMF